VNIGRGCVLFEAVTFGCGFARNTVCLVCLSSSLGNLPIPSPGGEARFSFPLFDRDHGGEMSLNKMDDV